MSAWRGLRPSLLLDRRMHPVKRCALYPLIATNWIWHRALLTPAGDAWDNLAWRHGWGRGRWRPRIGGKVSVHGGEPETILNLNIAEDKLTTNSGTYSLRQCCDPIDRYVRGCSHVTELIEDAERVGYHDGWEAVLRETETRDDPT